MAEKEDKKLSVMIYPFYATLDSAISLTLLAQQMEEEKTKNILSKSAIIHCGLVIESLANSLISNLQLQSKFENSIEKLDTIAKLEMFYMIWKSSPGMDRGKKCFQVFQELITIRNNYVHPKKYINEAKEDENGNYAILIKDKFTILEITKDTNLWTDKDALKCLNEMLMSLDYYIMEYLNLCNKRVEEIVFFNFKRKEGKGIIIPPKPYPWNKKGNEGYYIPKFLLRLESHDKFCAKSNNCKSKNIC
jgi:hypothetical protein